MRAVVITKHGPPSVLKVQDRPDPPPPAAGQVRISVRAAGVNFADHLARVGLYPDAPKVPSVVGYEVAGTIEAVGDGVDPARVGQRVLAGTRFGGYAEIVNAGANDTVPLPDSMSFEQGAAIPVNYATAWAACTATARCGPASRCWCTPRPAASASRRCSWPRPRARSCTARRRRASTLSSPRSASTAAIDYRRDGWWKGLGPYDIVLDAFGGTSLKRSIGLLRPGGRLVGLRPLRRCSRAKSGRCCARRRRRWRCCAGST